VLFRSSFIDGAPVPISGFKNKDLVVPAEYAGVVVVDLGNSF
jgi:hypothetical protein